MDPCEDSYPRLAFMFFPSVGRGQPRHLAFFFFHAFAVPTVLSGLFVRWALLRARARARRNCFRPFLHLSDLFVVIVIFRPSGAICDQIITIYLSLSPNFFLSKKCHLTFYLSSVKSVTQLLKTTQLLGHPIIFRPYMLPENRMHDMRKELQGQKKSQDIVTTSKSIYHYFSSFLLL